MHQHSEDLQALNETLWLNIEDFELLSFDLARELFEYGEPIPDYSTCDIGRLEASLASPRQTFDGKLLYPDLPKQASILIYSIIKNHPFQNGNKRIGVMTLLTFLSLNHKWLIIHPDRLYKIAILISESKPEEKDKVLKRLTNTIRSHLEDSEF